MTPYTEILKPKEPRDQALTVRLPKSTSLKLKEICAKSLRSQSEVIEVLVNDLWEQLGKQPAIKLNKNKALNEKV
jgi:hypothetical protein